MAKRTRRLKTKRSNLPKTFQFFQNGPKKHIVITVAIILTLILIFSHSINKGQTPQEPAKTLAEATTQAAIETLKESYEKEKGVSLKNLVPRYSIFENADYGYRFAYPVGYSYDWQGATVYLTPKSSKGKISVSINNNSPYINVNLAGADQKEAEALNFAAKFVEQTFEFTEILNIDKSKTRFTENPGSTKKY